MVLVVDKNSYYAYIISYKEVGFNTLSNLYIKDPIRLIKILGNKGCPHVFIQTCNRIEFYTYKHKIENILRDLTDYSYLLNYMKIIRGIDVFNHLIRVLCGLEAVALGEHQISGQVRTWFNIAKEHGTVNPELEYLFNECFKISKRIRSKFKFGKYIDYVSIVAELLNSNVKTRSKVVICGTGRTAEELLSRINLINKDIEIYIVSKDLSRAEKFAKKYFVIPLDYTNLYNLLPNVDAIIAATVSENYLIDVNHVDKLPPEILIIDLGMPPNINPLIKKYGVKLYTFEDLSKIISEKVNEGSEELEHINRFINQKLSEIENKLNNVFIEDIINKIYRRAEEIRRKEISEVYRYIKNKNIIDNGEILDILDKFSRSLTKKILHTYTRNLRMFSWNNDEHVFNIISRIFGDGDHN